MTQNLHSTDSKENKNALTAGVRLACLEIKSWNEEAINSTRKRIYSLKVFFTSYLIDVNTSYLFLNWFSTLVSDDRKYVCGRRLYACINTRFQRNYIIAKIKKVTYMTRKERNWKETDRSFWILEADSFFLLLKWNVFNSNKFFLVQLTLSKLN